MRDRPTPRRRRHPPGSVPAGTTELGIDIIKVDRIRAALERFGPRFSEARPDRCASGATSAIGPRPWPAAGRPRRRSSKVLGLGVRGIGWREIEIERLPTGQPAVRLHGRAAGRADQLGMDRIAVSISHESDYAVAIAFGIRTAGGRFVFPLDIEERLDDRERQILARIERLRTMAEAGGAAGSPPMHRRSRGRRPNLAGLGGLRPAVAMSVPPPSRMLGPSHA